MMYIPPTEGMEVRMKIKVTEEALEQLRNRYNDVNKAFRVMINGFG